MKRFLPLASLVALAGLAACEAADTPLLEPSIHLPAVTDGRDTGSGVFLLPPISDNLFDRTTPFDIDAKPRVEICRLDAPQPLTVSGIEGASCVELVAWFEREAAHDGSSLITLSPAAGQVAPDSQYAVGWKTDALWAGQAFRGTVWLPDLVVTGAGSIQVVNTVRATFDVVLYDNASTQFDSDAVIGYRAGQNFPVKFVVEQSADCDGLDCFAYEVTCEGGIFQTPHAGVSMPVDWASQCDTAVPGPEREWLLFQERLEEGSACVPSSLVDGLQWEPCYVWQLVESVSTGDGTVFEPYIQQFQKPVLVQWCNNEEADGGVPDELLTVTAGYRYSDPPGEAVRLEESSVEALPQGSYSCPYVADGADQTQLGLSSLRDGWVRPALRLLGIEPKPLFAGDGGVLTQQTRRMSHFQRITEFHLDAVSPATFSDVLGSTSELTIWLNAPPHSEPLDGPHGGVPGETIRYRVVSGDATISADGGTACLDELGAVIADCTEVQTSDNDPTTTTDEAGYATAELTLGGTAGPVVVEVSVPADPDMAPLTFSVEAVELLLVFLEPLETGAFYGSPDEAFAPTLYICGNNTVGCSAGPGQQLPAAAAVIPTGSLKLVTDRTGRKFYQADWKPRDTGTRPGGPYYVQVLVDGTTIGFSAVQIQVTSGGKGERIGNTYYNGENGTLAIKFTLTRP